jgi:hypothetical protein
MILVSGSPRALLPNSVPVLRGVGPASVKRPSTQATKRRPRKPLGSLWAESRSPTQNLRLLLRLLYQGLRKASRSSDQKGTLIFNILFSYLPINSQSPCRVLQDIQSASHANNPAPESESPKVDKPLSSSTRKNFLEMLKPPGPEDTKDVMPHTNPQC